MQAVTLPTGLQSPGVGFSNLGLAKLRWPAGLRAPSVGVYQGMEQVNLPDGLQDPSSLFNLSVEQVDMPAGQRFNLKMEEAYLPAGSQSLGLSLPNLRLRLWRPLRLRQPRKLCFQRAGTTSLETIRTLAKSCSWHQATRGSGRSGPHQQRSKMHSPR